MRTPTEGPHQYLRAWRLAKDMSLEQVANTLGIAVSSLSAYELGDRNLKLCDLQKLAEVYGVHVSALLMAPDDHPKAERMRKAATLAENMTEDAASDWLRMGERLQPTRPGG